MTEMWEKWSEAQGASYILNSKLKAHTQSFAYILLTRTSHIAKFMSWDWEV